MSSKYENFINKKRKLEQYIESFRFQMYEKQRIDKTGLNFSVKHDKDAPWHKNIVCTTAFHHGYYGNSSSSTDYIEGIEKELEKTLRELKYVIVETTIKRLKQDIIKSAKGAKKEIDSINKMLKEKDL